MRSAAAAAAAAKRQCRYVCSAINPMLYVMLSISLSRSCQATAAATQNTTEAGSTVCHALQLKVVALPWLTAYSMQYHSHPAWLRHRHRTAVFCNICNLKQKQIQWTSMEGPWLRGISAFCFQVSTGQMPKAGQRGYPKLHQTRSHTVLLLTLYAALWLVMHIHLPQHLLG